MADSVTKKRAHTDVAKSKAPRPSKKQRKLLAYHSDSDEVEAGEDFQPVNLLDSDEEDLENVLVDDGATSGSESGSGSDLETEKIAPQPKTTKPRSKAVAKDAPSSADDSEDDSDDYDEALGASQRHKSKRNDPEAFATSLTKILSTKLSTSRRADPVLARSATAHEASRQALDAALEAKARRRMREQKRLALEKGRVRDVLVATAVGPGEEDAEEATSTAEILAVERRLRRVAQRGVVRMFNAVRAAQVKAAEADRVARNQGIIGVKRREEKVSEMSRKGFLDLIASGGGGLKKGALEEA
jgi:hypothetical protein